jgi:hypothetical protein
LSIISLSFASSGDGSPGSAHGSISTLKISIFKNWILNHQKVI